MERENVEIWKPVVGYENYYAVSDMGNVKSIERTVTFKDGRKRYYKEKILKPKKKSNGYLHISLSKNGKVKTCNVHRLVAEAFSEICGEYFEGAQCNHIDEDKTNNTPENLNWMTPAQNTNYGTGIERRAKAKSKTVFQYDKDTHELVKEWQSAIEVYRQTGWSYQNISACCNGKRKSANNYIWSYTRL